MDHTCQYLCSELVTVTYEPQPGDIRQAVANLEEISADSAVVLLEERPSLGASISLSLRGRDLFGIIKGSFFDAFLGWYAIIAFDAVSLWNPAWCSPKHLLALCMCSSEGSTHAKEKALENTRYAEENLPVDFVVSEA
jgi:hypothetical protein